MMVKTKVVIYTEPPAWPLPGGGKELAFEIDATGRDGIWVDSDGRRPGSFLVGIGLVPVAPKVVDPQSGALYLDVTCDEIKAIQAMLQRVLDDNPA